MSDNIRNWTMFEVVGDSVIDGLFTNKTFSVLVGSRIRCVSWFWESNPGAGKANQVLISDGSNTFAAAPSSVADASKIIFKLYQLSWTNVGLWWTPQVYMLDLPIRGSKFTVTTATSVVGAFSVKVWVEQPFVSVPQTGNRSQGINV